VCKRLPTHVVCLGFLRKSSCSYPTKKITVQKTTPPAVTIPKSCTVTCGLPYTPDVTGCGTATCVDVCGEKLFVYPSDTTVTNYDGSQTVYRQWNCTDNCGLVGTATQTITIGLGTVTITVPADVQVPCGGDTSVAATGGPATASYGCGAITITYVDSNCTIGLGKIYRKWQALRDGIVVVTKIQTITVIDCSPTGTGIVNVPNTPITLNTLNPSTGLVTPKIAISDQNFPCETLTFVWTWGDGTPSTTEFCSLTNTDSSCSITGVSVLNTVSHTYTAVGAYTITVLVYDSQYDPSQLTTANSGLTWVKFSIIVQFVSISGHFTGSVNMNSNQPVVACNNAPWVIQGPANSGVGYSSFDCTDNIFFSFNGAFLVKADGTLGVSGDMLISSVNCQLLAYSPINLTHLTLFADDRSALFTGYGTYQLLPQLGAVPFQSYFTTSSPGSGVGTGATFWVRIWDNAGNVLFDTAPCQPTTQNITIQPPAPYSAIVGDSYLDIYNPTSQTISALTGEEAASSTSNIPIGIIVGVSVGIVVFVIIVALVVYFLLKTGQQQQNSPAAEKFVQM